MKTNRSVSWLLAVVLSLSFPTQAIAAKGWIVKQRSISPAGQWYLYGDGSTVKEPVAERKTRDTLTENYKEIASAKAREYRNDYGILRLRRWTNRFPAFGYTVVGYKFTRTTISTFWKFTNWLTRTVRNAIVAVRGANFWGDWRGARVVADGEMRYSPNSSEIAPYYRLGTIAAGASVIIEEKIEKKPSLFRWGIFGSYGRTFSFWEAKGRKG